MKRFLKIIVIIGKGLMNHCITEKKAVDNNTVLRIKHLNFGAGSFYIYIYINSAIIFSSFVDYLYCKHIVKYLIRVRSK